MKEMKKQNARKIDASEDSTVVQQQDTPQNPNRKVYPVVEPSRNGLHSVAILPYKSKPNKFYMAIQVGRVNWQSKQIDNSNTVYLDMERDVPIILPLIDVQNNRWLSRK